MTPVVGLLAETATTGALRAEDRPRSPRSPAADPAGVDAALADPELFTRADLPVARRRADAPARPAGPARPRPRDRRCCASTRRGRRGALRGPARGLRAGPRRRAAARRGPRAGRPARGDGGGGGWPAPRARAGRPARRPPRSTAAGRGPAGPRAPRGPGRGPGARPMRLELALVEAAARARSGAVELPAELLDDVDPGGRRGRGPGPARLAALAGRVGLGDAGPGELAGHAARRAASWRSYGTWGAHRRTPTRPRRAPGLGPRVAGAHGVSGSGSAGPAALPAEVTTARREVERVLTEAGLPAPGRRSRARAADRRRSSGRPGAVGGRSPRPCWTSRTCRRSRRRLIARTPGPAGSSSTSRCSRSWTSRSPPGARRRWVGRSTAIRAARLLADAAAPLGAEELDALAAAAGRVDSVVFALIRTEAHRGWRTVLEADRALVAEHVPRSRTRSGSRSPRCSPPGPAAPAPTASRCAGTRGSRRCNASCTGPLARRRRMLAEANALRAGRRPRRGPAPPSASDADLRRRRAALETARASLRRDHHVRWRAELAAARIAAATTSPDACGPSPSPPGPHRRRDRAELEESRGPWPRTSRARRRRSSPTSGSGSARWSRHPRGPALGR